MKKIHPFVGVDLTANVYSGSIAYTAADYSLTYDYSRSVRYGVAIGGGVAYRVADILDAVVGVKYNISNLLGKKSDLTGAHELNDAAYTVNGFSINQKTISYLNFYIGLSLNTAYGKKR